MVMLPDLGGWQVASGGVSWECTQHVVHSGSLSTCIYRTGPRLDTTGGVKRFHVCGAVCTQHTAPSLSAATTAAWASTPHQLKYAG